MVDWEAEYEAERVKFQCETLRTSALYRMVHEAADLLRDDHYPGPWSKNCARCAFVAKADSLFVMPSDRVLGIGEEAGG